MLTITNPNINRSGYGPLFINNIKRLATTTGVKFINKDHVCVINLVGMYMRLYKNNELLDHIDTTYNGKLCVSDLMDYYNGLIVISNFDCGTQSLYKIIDNKLIKYKDLPNFSKDPQFCHGVKFYPYKENILCFTFNRNKVFSVVFVNYMTNMVLYQFEYLYGYNPKDVAFINENEMVIGYSTSDVTPISTQLNYKSRIVYMRFDLVGKNHNIVDYFDVDNTHADCIMYKNNVIFLNDQMYDTVNTFCIVNNKIQFIESIKLFDKPHGMDIYDNLLAVANYGDNTVKIIEIPNKTQEFMKNN